MKIFKYEIIGMITFVIALVQVIPILLLPYFGFNMSTLSDWYIMPLSFLFISSGVIIMFPFLRYSMTKWDDEFKTNNKHDS